MTRETSIHAYNEIIENGLLNKLGAEVYKCVFLNGPITAQEAWHIIKEDPRSIIKNRRDGITQRFSELERRGVITTSGKRHCKISGRTVLQWIVTNNLPIKVEATRKHKCPTCGSVK